MNIRMDYLYRDAGNGKNWEAVVFPIPPNRPLQRVEKMLKDALLAALYFNTGLAGLAETKVPVSDSNGQCIAQWIEVLQPQTIGRINAKNPPSFCTPDGFLNQPKGWPAGQSTPV